MIYLVIFLAIVLFLLFCYYENNKIDTTYYNIKSKDAGKSFKIAHLSDFHSKPFKSILEKLINEKPDIICITGDYINDRCKNKDKMLDYAKKLLKIAPVYYITGNHERRLDNFNELMIELEKTGFNVLLNKFADNDYCTILGLDENQADFDDYKARKKGTFEYKDMSPYFKELEKSDKFKLVLSGHAHGGQWIMPFIGPLFSPGQGVLPKYARGEFGERPKLIVSRGLGNSEFPLRLFNHPEMIIINVKTK